MTEVETIKIVFDWPYSRGGIYAVIIPIYPEAEADKDTMLRIGEDFRNPSYVVPHGSLGPFARHEVGEVLGSERVGRVLSGEFLYLVIGEQYRGKSSAREAAVTKVNSLAKKVIEVLKDSIQ